MSRLWTPPALGSDCLWIGAATTSFATPADATAYFVSPISALATTNPTADGLQTFKMRRAGTIKQIDLFIAPLGTNGSAQTFSGYIRVNDTTDNTVFNNNLTANGGPTGQAFTSTTEVILAPGDFWIFKIITPTWTTNPTNLLVWGRIHIAYP
jgi:hypothetical protein